MVSGSLALLYFLLGFYGGRQGSGPDRGQSPVEWGDFPQASYLAGWASGLAGWPIGGDGRTDVRTDGKSPHSTGLRPLSGPLPKKKEKNFMIFFQQQFQM